MRILTTLIFILSLLTGNASNTQIDSLKNILYSGNPSVQEKAYLFNKIGLDLSLINKDSSNIYLKKALLFSRENNLKKELALSYHNFGEFHLHRGNYDSTRYYLDNAIILRSKLNLRTPLSQSYNVYGESYRLKGNYEKAVKNYLKAIKLAPDNSHASASAMTNLGLVYIKLNKLKEASDSFIKAIKVFKEEGSVQLIANCYNNLAMVEFYHDDYKKAIDWLKEALQIHIEHNNINGQATCYSNIGSTLMELGQYKEASRYLLKGLEKFQQLGSKDMANTLQINIGYLYLKQGKYRKSEAHLMKGLKEAEKQNNNELLKYATSYLSDLYSEKGNYKKANEYLNWYIDVKDSLISEKNSRELAKWEAKFKKEQRKKRIASLELEQRNNDLLLAEKEFQRNLIAGGGFIILVLLIFSFIYWKKRKESIRKSLNLQKEKVTGILKEKEIEKNSAIIEGQETERKRIAKDLHDRVGSMLATAKLHLSSGNEKSIKKGNEILDDIVQEVRRISHNLSSSSLMEIGLESSLHDLCQTVNSKEMEVTFFSYSMDKRLNSKVELVLYRCVQELISNIIKHSNASKVEIQLHRDDTGLNLMVEDNGIGFNENEITKGLGLRNIEDSIQSLHGSFNIDSYPKRGTNIIIHIPPEK